MSSEQEHVCKKRKISKENVKQQAAAEAEAEVVRVNQEAFTKSQIILKRQSLGLAPGDLTQFEQLLSLGANNQSGIVINSFLRRSDEGKALAAIGPSDTIISIQTRKYNWPISYQFGTYGSGPGQFDEPSCVAITSAGDIVVCDRFNHRVQVFHSDGQFVRAWGSQGAALGQFYFPRSVTMSSTDEVFVADTSNHRIQVFRFDGSFMRAWGSKGAAPGQFQYPFGVALHGDLVLVSDEFNHRIQCFGLDGTFVRMWGSQVAAPGQFNCPQGLAVSSAGEVFVCDEHNHRVQVFGLDGTYLRSWESKGNVPGQFQQPTRVAVSPVGSQTESATLPLRGFGEVLVSDQTRVQVFLANGTFVRSMYLPAGANGNFHPSGMAVTHAGDVVVCDVRNHRVYIEPAGA